MTSRRIRKFLSMFIRALIIILALVAAPAARAADAVYPQGARVGLAPPPGMVASKTYAGFEDAAADAHVLVTEVPLAAFGDIEKRFSAEALKSQGLSVVRREEVKSKDWRGFILVSRQDLSGVPVHKWFLVASGPDLAAVVTAQIPDAAQKLYSDAVLRAAMVSTVFRPIPVAERLALLPYAMADLAGFRLLQTSTEGTALLTEGPKDIVTQMDQPVLLVNIVLGQTPQPAGYDGFARQVVATIPGLKDVTIVSAQALAIGTQPGYEVVGEAKDENSGAEISLVQWLRFGGTGYLRILGVAPRKAWAAAFPRMRTVRDGIGPKK